MRTIKKGATSQSVYVEILDSTSTTGGRKTGLAFDTAGLTAYYVRNQGSATAITLATLAAANSAWSSGGFKEVDATNMPGVYRLDVPDAALASGADDVSITLKGATGMAQVSLNLPLVDNLASDVYARLGAPAGASVSADIAQVYGVVDTEIAAVKAKTDNLPSDPADASDIAAAFGTVNGTLATIAGYIDTEVAAIKAKTDSLTFTVAGQVDCNVTNWKGATAPAMTGDAFARLGAPAGVSVSADVAAVKAVLPAALVSGRIDASVGAMASGVVTAAALATDAGAEIADAVWDEAISGHLTAGSTGNALNAAGSAGDPWSTALPGAYGAGSAGKIIGDNINATISSRLASASYTAPDNASITAIKAKTDNLPTDPADQSLIIAATDALATLIGDVPTNAELSTALAAADDATLAAIAALSIPTANQNADALLDRAAGVETNRTVRQALRIVLAAVAGKASGMGTTTATIRDTNDTVNRIVATVDADGNRSAVTLDAS